ncbi:MAG: DUF5046 domain-containing protein [Clostridiales Family XIII bacterium]|jgi:hypothetical protein|nr:DUF5046 domain-containing protein [Clostridiales Family XIII bacterium]
MNRRIVAVLFLTCTALALASCARDSARETLPADAPAIQDSAATDATVGVGSATDAALGADALTESAVQASPAALDSPTAELYSFGGGQYEENPCVTIVDKNGNFIAKGAGYEIVYNFDNTAAVAIKRKKYEESGSYLMALFDVKGKMLYDFGPYDYFGDKGTLVRRYAVTDKTEMSNAEYGIGSRYSIIDMADGKVKSGTHKAKWGEGFAAEPYDKYFYVDGYEYFDGSVGIKEDDGYDLVDSKGETLFDDADEIKPFAFGGDGMASSFLAKKNNTYYKLSRNGKAIAKHEFKGDGYQLGDGYIFAGGAILDSDFKVLTKGYDNAEAAYTELYSYPDYYIYVSAHYLGNRRYIIGTKDGTNDVFDERGQAVWQGLRHDGYISYGPNRIALRQGFSQGLMDETGKWLYKESIFQTLDD